MRRLVAAACVAAALAAHGFDFGTAPSWKVRACGDATVRYAAEELVRLLGRAGVKATVESVQGEGFSVGVGAELTADLADVRWDGFAVASSEGGLAIAATGAKGVLNGVYATAEEMGFAFLMPGASGERVPVRLGSVAEGLRTFNPRFPWRGIFGSSVQVGRTDAEYYRFLAKLRFNAFCSHAEGSLPDDVPTLKLLGFRYEAGGHGMSACLPRKLFETEPELFRMFQPEDFGGRRQKDSNFCITNPKTRRIVKDGFRKMIAPAVTGGVHAVHAWADDLPGGGWCMCSRCRALSPTDQSALTMNVEAEAVRELGANLRVPVLAYHDTMFPSALFAPDPLCYLLFAPRERCYAHALNDETCARNRGFLQALRQYAARFRGIDDAHTFEYYNDKILFRGHTPYLPQVILGDADCYEENGIESWMSLQVGGELQAVDWNMLAHARVAWERELTGEQLTRRLALAAGGDDPEPFVTYLTLRAAAYASAWALCNQAFDAYLDYRFMPECAGATGAATVEGLRRGAALHRASLAALAARPVVGAGAALADLEARRGRFEAADLEAMVLHQQGLVHVTEYLAGGGDEVRRAAVAELKRAADALDAALAEYERFWPGDNAKMRQYYPGFVKTWSKPEILNKVRVYGWGLD